MKIKKIIKLFIPPVFLRIFNLCKEKMRIKDKTEIYYSTINTHSKTTDTLFVLGNGPSLKGQLEGRLEIFASYTCICVNHFVLTGYYTKIKPRFYLLIDPALFIPVLDQEIEKKNLSMFDNLFSKTAWNIDLIVNSYHRNNERILSLQRNPYINVLFINFNPAGTFHSNEERFNLYNKNRIPPPAQTVLNTAVYLGIFWRYKNVVLVGADTSLHEDLMVDQKTNALYIGDKHFYGTERRKSYKDDRQSIPFKIHEYLLCVVRMFENYWLLRDYADFNSVKVFNASANSYIDAFERITLDEFSSKKMN